MSFLNSSLANLSPYVPGEQPQGKKFLKLNTNESPFPPAPSVQQAVAAKVENLQLYSDATQTKLREVFAKQAGIDKEEVMFGNGSDELLAWAFMGFMENGVIFPAISYGFYEVYAKFYHLEYEMVPLAADFSLSLAPYSGSDKVVVIANPNAPTGLSLSASKLLELVAKKPERLVIIDEAYVDFGGESLLPYIHQYDNLLVLGTFSKSRQLAGGRVGYAVGNKGLIAALNRVRFSFNPYNVNSLSLEAATAALADQTYFETCRKAIIKNRESLQEELRRLGFETTDSKANFVFVTHPKYSGKDLYQALREKNILVRWFDKPEITNYLRITIGKQEQMTQLVAALTEILEEWT